PLSTPPTTTAPSHQRAKKVPPSVCSFWLNRNTKDWDSINHGEQWGTRGKLKPSKSPCAPCPLWFLCRCSNVVCFDLADDIACARLFHYTYRPVSKHSIDALSLSQKKILQLTSNCVDVEFHSPTHFARKSLWTTRRKTDLTHQILPAANL